MKLEINIDESFIAENLDIRGFSFSRCLDILNSEAKDIRVKNKIRFPTFILDNKLIGYSFAKICGYKIPDILQISEPIENINFVKNSVIKPMYAHSARGVYISKKSNEISYLNRNLLFTSSNDAKKHASSLMKKGFIKINKWMVEGLLGSRDSLARDIKFYCFYGEVGLILETEREPVQKRCWYDSSLNYIDTGKYSQSLYQGNRNDLEKLKAIAESLSSLIPSPFVRIDFLVYNDEYYIGEFTPSPSGYRTFNNRWDKKLGELFIQASVRLSYDISRGKVFEEYNNCPKTEQLAINYLKKQLHSENSGQNNPKKNKKITLNNKITIFNGSSNIVLQDFHSKKNLLPILSGPYVTSYLFNQKNIDLYCNPTKFYSIYSSLGYQYLIRKTFKNTSLEKARVFCKSLLENNKKVLVTPYNNLFETQDLIKSLNELDSVWKKYSKKFKTVTFETYQEGDPFKIFFKGNKILGVYALVPAFVVGNGHASLGQLIDKLRIDRGNNILYKNYPLENIDNALNMEIIPLKGEVVQLKNSRLIRAGACYIDLSDKLSEKYQPLINRISNLSSLNNYMEMLCFSEDINIGPDHDTFYISDIMFNKCDLRHLVSCYKSLDQVEALLQALTIEESTQMSKNGISSLLVKDVFCKSGGPIDILENAANRLGLEFYNLGSGLSLIKERETAKKRYFWYGMSQFTTLDARLLSNNKLLTKKTLQNNAINTPVGKSFKILEKKEALGFIASSKQLKWVLKPLDGSGGVGVTTGITNNDDLEKAWEVCESLANCKTVILEEEVSGQDYRIVVIQNNVFSVTQRIAAYVIGDGIHTISDLIKHKAIKRKKNPFYAIKTFKENKIIRNYLEKKGIKLTDVPAKGEKVSLLDAVNIGSGGESIDRTDLMHPDWIDIAVKVRKAIPGAYHVGIDLMTDDISRSPHNQKWSIIEVNTNPDLGLVLFPGTGEPRDIAKALITSVFGELTSKQKISYELTIVGKVQKVGFRKWFKQLCDSKGISGRIWNDSDRGDLVKAVVQGYEVTLEDVIRSAYEGPSKAKVRDVIINNIEYDPGEGNGFTVI